MSEPDVSLAEFYEGYPNFSKQNTGEFIAVIVVLGLLFLKTIYVFAFDNTMKKTTRLKKLIYIVMWIFMLVTVLCNTIATFFAEKVTWRLYFKIFYVTDFITEVWIDSCFALVFLYWISVLENDFKVKKDRYPILHKILFFGVFFIPNSILSICSLIFLYHSSLTTDDNLLVLMKLKNYYLFSSNTLIVLILWAYLIRQLIILDITITKKIKTFFIVAFFFSLNQILYLVFNLLGFNFNYPTYYYYPSFVFKMCLVLQLIFVIDPINFRLIKNKILGRSNTPSSSKDQANQISNKDIEFDHRESGPGTPGP
ncbi:hypothetical protein CYY_007333 [Polysphondylium violaceum]|uniref:Uncharacterized protein n=1 Tax=Polysphondylium violaceum TaxID=133409 RepID=A0A8J4UQY5_9MYCE|nr:hypothetical protein CYY_007333 [Polysphondylium violaceum]